MINFLAISFLLTIQGLTLILFSLNSFLGIQLTPGLGQFSVVLSLLFVTFIAFKYGYLQMQFSFKSWSRLDKLLLVLLCFIYLSLFFVSFWLPVTAWDSVTLYDFRARIILNTGWIRDTLFRSPITTYPLLTSLSHWLVYSLGLSTPLPIYPLFYSSFLIVSYFLFRRRLSKTVSLLATLLLALAPKMFDQALNSYTNLPYSVYLILGAGYLQLWLKNHRRNDFMLGMLFSILSLWVRSFPFVLANIFVVIWLMPKFHRWRLLIVSLIGLVAFFWLFLMTDLTQLQAVLDFLIWSIFKYYWPYWLLFGLGLIYWYSLAAKNLFWPALITCYTAILVIGTYFYSLSDPDFAVIPDTIQRTTMFMNLAIIFFITGIYSHEFNKSKNNLSL